MSEKTKMKYGPSNPHPLSQLRTELVWEGKYDEFGSRREVNSASYSMPLQRIEALDYPLSHAQAQGSLFDEKKAHKDSFRNCLIWGDNKLVMSSLVSDFKGAIDLIYIDPPFDVGADFTMRISIGDDTDQIVKDQSLLEMVAYRDTWGRGLSSYLHMISERLQVAKDLLSEKGAIFVHCDWHVGHFLRCVLDDVFGRDNFKNEIIWSYRKFGRVMDYFPRSHDNIFFYSLAHNHTFNPQYVPLSESTLKRWGGKKRGGKDPYNRYATDEDSEGAAMPDVWDIPLTIGANPQNTGFQTQKPEALLERVILGCSSEDSIVADFFCGSGTTAAVAEKLGRKWIACDIGRFAVHTTRKRLIGVQRELHEQGKSYRPFDIYNLGRYERQWWQKEALKGADEEHRALVLKFFRAEALLNAPSPLIHGRKATAFVHVDGIDSIFSREEVKEVARAVKAAGGKQVHCLAWDFEMDIRQAVAGIETEYDVKIRLHRIPREIMEKNRTELPPFFEVALLEAEPVIRKGPKAKTVEIKLKNFLPSLTEVPSKELEALQERAVQSGFDFIDFWAIDFDWASDRPFNHHWQDYRTRKDRSLKTVSDAEFSYDKPGKHTACVKVVDVFGCDTSITVEVEV